MIIFKLIPARFKQNLGPRVQNFILEGLKNFIKNYIYIILWPGQGFI